MKKRIAIDPQGVYPVLPAVQIGTLDDKFPIHVIKDDIGKTGFCLSTCALIPVPFRGEELGITFTELIKRIAIRDQKGCGSFGVAEVLLQALGQGVLPAHFYQLGPGKNIIFPGTQLQQPVRSSQIFVPTLTRVERWFYLDFMCTSTDRVLPGDVILMSK